MERTIQVVGNSKSTIKPDSVRLIFCINEVEKNYQKARKLTTQKTELLRNCFEELGFDKKALKTVSFCINPTYKDAGGNKNDGWEQKFAGYECSHRVKIEFQNEEHLLEEMIHKLEKLSIKPDMQTSYYIKDIKSRKKELMEQAVSNAMEKAEILARAADVSLDKIVKIDYTGEQSSIEIEKLCCYNKDSIDFEPDEIEMTESVIITWSII